eukprot:TRINITY_DN2080_c0_g1_i1.p1 TRINITY_DN2080_c0_g1~~TRINITY_DN2080_c0_g1_i1.p1  ORF type:complete len:298 (-),score=57.62 TRINITY_DN2080_c0_g1_i1:30-923(-)
MADVADNFVTLTHSSGASAKIYVQGAHVASFKTDKGQEVLYMSSKTQFKKGGAIRGGIPVIFPQFSDAGPLPKHGWVRNVNWTVVKQESSTVTFELTDDEESLKIWPHKFRLQIDVTIGHNDKQGAYLHQECRFRSEDITQDAPTFFTTALHTYFAVEDVRKIQITGLRKSSDPLFYLDNTQGRSKSEEERNELDLSGEIDRIYLNTGDTIIIHDINRDIIVEKKGFKDATVWNIWEQKAKNMADLGENEWLKYVCIEPCLFTPPGQLVHQTPNASEEEKNKRTWVGSQTIFVKNKL